MKNYLNIVMIGIILWGCSTTDSGINNSPDSSQFYKGMDLSFQSELEDFNVTYKDESGNTINLLDYVTDNGVNLIRLKLWHSPLDGQNSLDDVKAYAQRIKASNADFLLDIHYSDYWADPGTQTPPAAWQNMTYEAIKIAIYNYTKDVVTELKNQNTLPKIIQIGNETDSGFLWNYGKVWNEFSDNWSNYTTLVSEAIRAIRDIDPERTIEIMLHHSSVENAIFFFNEIEQFNVDFDIIGLSYYPQFQTKDLNLVATKLNELANTFEKDILMVEVAYPFTLQWNDNQTNFIGDLSQTIPQFAPTPEGQKAYLEWLIETVKNIPQNRGKGFCYWAPDWVAFSGNENTSTQGSSWENQCVFDFDRKALPVLDVFNTN